MLFRVFPKKYHNFNCMSLPQLLTDMLLPTFADFISQKFKSNDAMVFSPEEEVEIVIFWYKNKL